MWIAMQRLHFFTCLLAIFTCIAPSLQSNENQLIFDLKKVSPFARPVRNTSDAVVVTFGYELVHVVSIVESEQTVTQKIWLRMSWKNEFMTWNPEDYGGVKKTRLNMASVWTPDLFLQEDVSSDMSTGPLKYMTQVTLNSNGIQNWYVPVLLESSCTFDVRTFPFDKQSCVLKFTPWTHTQNEVDLKIDKRPVITASYVNSSEWDVVSVERERKSMKYACCPHPFVDVRYTTHLKRKPLYYVYSVIVPCIIQMVIILFTFFLPPDSGERIGVVITVLLVFAVYLEVLSQSLPKTSTSTPALSKFYITAMAESAMSLIATCLVLIFHFKGSEQGAEHMPKWARVYFIDYLSRFLYVRIQEREHESDEEGQETDKLLEEKPPGGGGAAANGINNQLAVFLDSKGGQQPSAVNTLVEEVRRITALISDQNKSDEIEAEWQTLAKIFDRLFFIAFFFVFLVSSLVILMPIYAKHYV